LSLKLGDTRVCTSVVAAPLLHQGALFQLECIGDVVVVGVGCVVGVGVGVGVGAGYICCCGAAVAPGGVISAFSHFSESCIAALIYGCMPAGCIPGVHPSCHSFHLSFHLSVNSGARPASELSPSGHELSTSGKRPTASQVPKALAHDFIAASIYHKYSIGPSTLPICTRCCFTMTYIIQV